MTYVDVFETPVSFIKLTTDTESVVSLEFLSEAITTTQPTNAVAKKAIAEIQSYFANPKMTFTVPVSPKGTDFQKKAWQAMRAVPLGTTVNYGDLGDKLKTAPRPIANACRSNPVPIIVPCHRVVAKGALGGFAGKKTGHLLAIKRWLLDHEKKYR